MSMLKILGAMAKQRVAAASAPRAARPVRTRAPLGLHQESAVEFSPVAQVLVAAAGGMMPEFEHNQFVTAVGRFQMFGFDVFRSYLSDGRSFIQTVADRADPARAVECRLYVTHHQAVPAAEAEWNFLLAEADGYIGYPMFQLDAPGGQQVQYPRLWSPGPSRIEPVVSHETLVHASGATSRVEHRSMQYARRLGGGSETDLSEYLVAAAVISDEGATFDVFLGLDLDVPATLKVFASAA